MKGLIKLLILLAVIFFISSIFKGGDYIRLISKKTGISLYSLSDVADTLRIDSLMDKKKRDQREREKALGDN